MLLRDLDMTPKRIGLVIILFLVSVAATAALVFTKRFDAFLVYVVLTLVMTTVMVKLVRPFWVKWAVGLVSLLALWEMGHIDEWLGEYQHRQLCKQSAGVNVYGTIHLPTNFYNDDGTPKYLDAKFNPNEEMLKPYARIISTKENVSTQYVNIDKYRYQVFDASNNSLLGEIVEYHRATSPFIPTIAQAGGHLGWCESYGSDRRLGKYQELFQRVFIR